MIRKAVFLDRDGVLNNTVLRDGVTRPPDDAESLELLPGAAGAVARLRAAGYVCVCVTNQPDIARGTRSLANVLAMNEKVRNAIVLDDLLFCPHDDADACSCRKPKPGMLLTAAKKWNMDLPGSWMIGDRPSDILAGKRAGCRGILIGVSAPPRLPDAAGEADAIAADLPEAADIVLARG